MYKYIFNPHIHRLPVGLIAQLVKHGTGVAKVRVQVPIKPKVYRPYALVLSVDSCNEDLLLFNSDKLICEFNVQIIEIGQIGENRLWEMGYIILLKIPSKKLRAKMLNNNH